jgi:hypothetical protein
VRLFHKYLLEKEVDTEFWKTNFRQNTV